MPKKNAPLSEDNEATIPKRGAMSGTEFRAPRAQIRVYEGVLCLAT